MTDRGENTVQKKTMNITSRMALAVLMALFIAGCGTEPRNAGLKFKARIETALEATNSVKVADALNELGRYKNALNAEDERKFFSAWSPAGGNYEIWLAGVKLKLLQIGDTR